MKSGGLLHDRRVHAGPAADRNEGVVVSRRMTPREQNKALAAEGAQHQRATARQWMTFRKDDHEPFADDRFHRQPAVGRRQPQKAGMDLSLMEHSTLFAGPQQLKREIDVRVTLAEHRQQPREDVELGGGHVADDQFPSLATRCLARDVRRALRLGESQPRFNQEGSACVCQLNSAICPIEEAHAEFLLEATNLLTQWRLRDVQALRGSTEVQLVRDSDEIAEMTKLHK
jgi:hypothetical protein